MNQFNKQIIISFKEGDESSLKNALIEYQNLLNSDKAFTGRFMGIFNIEFKIETTSGIRRLQTSDTKNKEILKQALSMGPEHRWTTQNISDTDEIYISEPIFIAIALEYESLTKEIVNTAEAIVAIMRKNNNTDDVWIDNMCLFGVEALFMLACKHSKYTYLLGHFFIPYWDLEHAVNYEEYLYYLVKNKGWTRDLIKAYIWCDNGHFRYNMYTSDNYNHEGNTNIQTLGSFLKNSPAEYEWFKTEVIHRFKKEPFILYSEQTEIADSNPVIELFITLENNCSEYWDSDEKDEDTEAFLRSHFITDTVENEAHDLLQMVIPEVNRPLAKYTEKDLLSREQSAYFDKARYRGDGVKDLKEFIIALQDGPTIWNYIETGDNKDILQQLTKTELIPVAKKNAKNFYFELTYYTDPLDYEGDIKNHLASILSNVTYDLISAEEEDDKVKIKDFGNGYISTLKISNGEYFESNKNKKNDQYLRILDVFFRLLDVNKFHSEIEDIVIDEQSPLLSHEEYYLRYSKSKKVPKKKKTKLNINIFGSSENEIDYDVRKHIELAIAQNGREAFNCSDWDTPKLSTITLASYLVYSDRIQMFFDDHTTLLLKYLDQDPWGKALKQILKNTDTKKLTEEELDLLKDYITSKEFKPKATEEYIINILQNHLYREECYRGNHTFNKYSEKQPSYALFFYKDGFQHILLCCFWMRNFMPPLCIQANRIWQLFLKIAPQRVIKQIGKFYSDDYSVVRFDDENREENFYKELEKAKIPKEQLNAFKMSSAQNLHTISEPCNIEEYTYWLNLYDDIDDENCGMIGAARKNNAIALEKGMHFINEKNRLKYYTDLAIINPRFPFDQTYDLERCLNRFIEQKKSNDSTIDSLALKNMVMDYLNEKVSYSEIKNAFEQNIDPDLSNNLDRLTMYSISDFIWQLKTNQRNKLITLILNHNYTGYNIVESDIFYAYLRQMVKKGEISMEHYLDLSPEQETDETNQYIEDAYEYLYDTVSELNIRTDFLMIFLLKHNNLPYYSRLLVDMIRNNEAEEFIKNSSISQKTQLIQILSQEPDAPALVVPFTYDKSRKVKDLALSIQ